jgi:cellulose synthase (UDP-forming)
MQVLVLERLWAAKRWMSWRSFHEYLSGTLWWFEGLATLGALVVPIAVLASGADASRAAPVTFAWAFGAMLAVRLWGAKLLMRSQVHWRTAFALRVLRVPVGIACGWWLVTRRTLGFEVTPKGAADERHRGRLPGVLSLVIGAMAAVLAYGAAGLAGIVPWRSSASTTVACGLWLAVASVVLLAGGRRIQSVAYATSRRGAYRVDLDLPITVEDEPAVLVDLSVGGAAVRLRSGVVDPVEPVLLRLPGADPVAMAVLRVTPAADGTEVLSLRVGTHDVAALRTLSLWLFHTPAGAVPGLADGAPAVAILPIRAS